MSDKIETWSYSRYSSYKKCPFAAKRQFIDKAKFIENDATRRGNRIHKSAEKFIKRRRGFEQVPEEFKDFEKDLIWLRDNDAIAEEQWGFDENWEICEYFSSKIKIKVDAHLFDDTTLIIVDHKTGKQYEDHEEQLELYAVGGFKRFDGLTHVVAEMWYVDQDDILSRIYKIGDLDRLVKLWEKRTKALLSDTRFAPNPTGFCKRCQFANNKQGDGTCKYG